MVVIPITGSLNIESIEIDNPAASAKEAPKPAEEVGIWNTGSSFYSAPDEYIDRLEKLVNVGAIDSLETDDAEDPVNCSSVSDNADKQEKDQGDHEANGKATNDENESLNSDNKLVTEGKSIEPQTNDSHPESNKVDTLKSSFNTKNSTYNSQTGSTHNSQPGSAHNSPPRSAIGSDTESDYKMSCVSDSPGRQSAGPKTKAQTSEGNDINKRSTTEISESPNSTTSEKLENEQSVNANHTSESTTSERDEEPVHKEITIEQFTDSHSNVTVHMEENCRSSHTSKAENLTENEHANNNDTETESKDVLDLLSDMVSKVQSSIKQDSEFSKTPKVTHADIQPDQQKEADAVCGNEADPAPNSSHQSSESMDTNVSESKINNVEMDALTNKGTDQNSGTDRETTPNSAESSREPMDTNTTEAEGTSNHDKADKALLDKSCDVLEKAGDKTDMSNNEGKRSDTGELNSHSEEPGESKVEKNSVSEKSHTKPNQTYSQKRDNHTLQKTESKESSDTEKDNSKIMLTPEYYQQHMWKLDQAEKENPKANIIERCPVTESAQRKTLDKWLCKVLGKQLITLESFLELHVPKEPPKPKELPKPPPVKIQPKPILPHLSDQTSSSAQVPTTSAAVQSSAFAIALKDYKSIIAKTSYSAPSADKLNLNTAVMSKPSAVIAPAKSEDSSESGLKTYQRKRKLIDPATIRAAEGNLMKKARKQSLNDNIQRHLQWVIAEKNQPQPGRPETYLPKFMLKISRLVYLPLLQPGLPPEHFY